MYISVLHMNINLLRIRDCMFIGTNMRSHSRSKMLKLKSNTAGCLLKIKRGNAGVECLIFCNFERKISSTNEFLRTDTACV